MHDAVFAVGAVAVVAALIAAIRTVREREPLWKLLSGFQLSLMGMMILLIVSNAAHSATLDLIDTAYGFGIVAFALFVWNSQKRFMSGRR